MRPLLSVVVGNYNYGRFLEQCLDSALSQSYAPIEVVVVDDGSTDESRAVLGRFGSRVRAVLQRNVGQAGALSVGVTAANGEVVALLDADDGWHTDKASEVVDALQANPRAGWLRHKLALVDESLRPLGRSSPAFTGSELIDADVRWILERVVTAATSSIVLRRSALAAAFPLPSRREFAFDADLLILARLFAGRVPGYSLDRTLGWYRRHSGQRFVGEADVPAMLQRELAVAEAVAKALGRSRDRSVASAKHRVVLAALAGTKPWQRERLAPLAQGIATAAAYADLPRLAARQLVALLFAGVAPRLWLRKLERSMPLAGALPGTLPNAPDRMPAAPSPSSPSRPVRR